MGFIESVVYAVVSGVTEFFPVSSKAHQALLVQLFGVDKRTGLFDLLIHIAILTALLGSCQTQIANLSRTQKLLAIPPKRRKRQPELELVSRLRFIKTSAVPIVLLTTLFFVTYKAADHLQLLSIFLLINGVVLYALNYLPHSNKGAQYFSGIEAFLIGFCSGFGIVPGISRVGVGTSLSVIRGASQKDAYEWCLILSIPAVVALCLADFIVIIFNGIGSFSFLIFLQYLFGALMAYVGAFFSIMFMRHIVAKFGVYWFSFYNWGLALFSFIIFML